MVYNDKKVYQGKKNKVEVSGWETHQIMEGESFIEIGIPKK